MMTLSPTIALLATLLPPLAGAGSEPPLVLAGVRIDTRPDAAVVAAIAPATPAQTAAAPGRHFRDRLPDGSSCSFCPEMVVAPAGRFKMGTAAADWASHEGPLHAVEIGHAFAIGRYEVTFAQWDACVDDGGCRAYRPADDGQGRGHRPVGRISHDDANAFVRWLNRRLDLDPETEGYRLPSEAEWEYAARAGARSSYWWGGREPVCIDGARAGARFDDGGRCDAAGSAPVGSYPANRFGLHDVAGNLREWVADCWHDSYDRAPADGSAWMNRGDCVRRVLRGGSWRDRADALRAAWRTGHATGMRLPGTGFRLARSLGGNR